MRCLSMFMYRTLSCRGCVEMNSSACAGVSLQSVTRTVAIVFGSMAVLLVIAIAVIITTGVYSRKRLILRHTIVMGHSLWREVTVPGKVYS